MLIPKQIPLFLVVVLSFPLRALAEAGDGAAPCAQPEPCVEVGPCDDPDCDPFAAAAAPPPAVAPERTEGEACGDGAPCADGLLCLGGVCRGAAPPPGDEDDDEAPARQESRSAPPSGCHSCVPGVGEPCRSHGDCLSGLGCREGRCRRVEHQLLSGDEDEPPTGARSRGDCALSLEGTRGFLGVTLGPGVDAAAHGSYGTRARAGLIAALRAGALFDRTELAVELAPYSMLYSFEGDAAVALDLTAGWLAPLPGSFYWPIRAGAGLAIARDPLRGSFFSAPYLRADLIGFAYHRRRVLVHVALPSLRYHPSWSGLVLWDDGDGESSTCHHDGRCGAATEPTSGFFAFFFTVSVSYLL